MPHHYRFKMKRAKIASRDTCGINLQTQFFIPFQMSSLAALGSAEIIYCFRYVDRQQAFEVQQAFFFYFVSFVLLIFSVCYSFFVYFSFCFLFFRFSFLFFSFLFVSFFFFYPLLFRFYFSRFIFSFASLEKISFLRFSVNHSADSVRSFNRHLPSLVGFVKFANL